MNPFENNIKTCDTILDRIKNWNDDLETGIEIIERNENDIIQMQNEFNEFPKEPKNTELEEDYRQKIEELARELKSFVEKIEEKKLGLLDEKKQFNNNIGTITNYISPHLKSVFIDREI
jgi:pullulanase/glycogen debranching enzyme